jgi:hypothetical protein
MIYPRRLPAIALTDGLLRFADFAAWGGDGLSGAVALASELPGTHKPKKRGPFQAVPVMARAMAERLK